MNSRLLLVEDEPGLSLTVTDLLEAEGYHVDTAMDGPTGLTKAGTGDYDFTDTNEGQSTCNFYRIVTN